MMKTVLFFALTLLLMIPIAGCLNLPREELVVQRYSIDPPEDVTPTTNPTDYSIMIMPFQVGAEQKGERILFRDDRFGKDYYFYHRWIVSPEKMLRDALAEHLKEWGLFGGGVFLVQTGVVPNYELHGRLSRLYVDNTRKKYSAVLEVEITLLKIDPVSYTKTMVFQNTYSITEPRENKRIATFIEAANITNKKWIDLLEVDLFNVVTTESNESMSLPKGETTPVDSSSAVSPPEPEKNAPGVPADST